MTLHAMGFVDNVDLCVFQFTACASVSKNVFFADIGNFLWTSRLWGLHLDINSCIIATMHLPNSYHTSFPIVRIPKVRCERP
jgi:hypothetical protein